MLCRNGRAHRRVIACSNRLIAIGAGVPIATVALDFPAKLVRILPPFVPTGDYQRDLPIINNHHQTEMARHAATF
jgi:hypothetical protein